MERYWFRRPVDKGNIVVVNGPSSALELLLKLITCPGDCVITPRPCYASLFVEWWVKAGVCLFLADSEEDYELSVDCLEEAY